jgi:23S rRNA-/tRNA-specific pseudouridylate synthase
VFGHPEQDTWVVDAPITVDETDEKGFKMRVARADEPAGKASQTEVEVLTRGYYNLEGIFKGSPISRVLLRPLTGRRHQIRVHLQLSGYPIVGDSAYANDKDSHRMFLLAHELVVPLPDRPLHVTLPEPFAWQMALSSSKV